MAEGRLSLARMDKPPGALSSRKAKNASAVPGEDRQAALGEFVSWNEIALEGLLEASSCSSLAKVVLIGGGAKRRSEREEPAAFNSGLLSGRSLNSSVASSSSEFDEFTVEFRLDIIDEEGGFSEDIPDIFILLSPHLNILESSLGLTRESKPSGAGVLEVEAPVVVFFSLNVLNISTSTVCPFRRRYAGDMFRKEGDVLRKDGLAMPPLLLFPLIGDPEE